MTASVWLPLVILRSPIHNAVTPLAAKAAIKQNKKN
jgi:hypothetical protein